MQTSTLDAATGTMVIDLASLSPDALGEILRAHVYGPGKGYRDMDVQGPYAPVAQEILSDDIVDEVLGDPECRDDWMRVRAWSNGPLTIAWANDGDTSLLFRLVLPNGTRTIVNHDAKHDHGWSEVEGPAS
ncbi:hypothetical protein [uncultured Salinicola sp.]|uniref:hypothetical protein n=1 Tax=uncultured Salinicola sp. TaxID=1193542 RepID=UPI002621678D|nr:hypothetical protein [uncultured Salinicola sp.]|tara:strand:+ start:853 stop:1245 length:393 start_codon:yes stop_codon:yes gene_type:complete